MRNVAAQHPRQHRFRRRCRLRGGPRLSHNRGLSMAPRYSQMARVLRQVDRSAEGRTVSVPVAPR